MNAKTLVVLLAASVGLAQVHAQNVVIVSGLTVMPATVQTPVAAPAPAICPAPGVCQAPWPCPTPVACPSPYPYAGYTPNVFYFGGPYSYLRNYYNGNAVYSYPYSQVVPFGRGEAWQRGYYFNWQR